ncbi:MAG: hypothetical protein KBS59_01625 [Clostridiales bacterium]|nr:hypothetical protein [Clostridiales bacterium]
MLPVILIFAISCLAMITLVFVKPSAVIFGRQINIYWAAPLLGAVIMTVFGFIAPREIASGLLAQTEINPLKILVLFFSMTFMSIYLDAAGFFKTAATFILSRAKTSQKTLFLLLYVTVSLLTVFTSNDIIVLTFTPFICYFSKNANIDPVPYLFCEFIAANTWSMALIIGNPTNIYLATGAGATFLGYIKVMLLPTAFAGITSFIVMWLMFARKLQKPIEHPTLSEPLENKPAAILGGVHLALCIAALVVCSYVDIPMWIISLTFAVSLCICTLIMNFVRGKRNKIIAKAIIRVPFELIPFVISMFVLVLALEKTGVTETLGNFLSSGNAALRFALASTLSANVVNNIPMSVMFSSITSAISGSESYVGALYASVIGSNICAFLKPIGALAGIMWMSLLRARGIDMSFAKFTKYGAAVAVLSLLAAFAGLILVT